MLRLRADRRRMDPLERWQSAKLEFERAEAEVHAMGLRLRTIAEALIEQPHIIRTDKMFTFDPRHSDQFTWLEVGPTDLPDYQSFALRIEMYHHARAELLRTWAAIPEEVRINLEIPAGFGRWSARSI